jgi:site-specific recombinase XerD
VPHPDLAVLGESWSLHLRASRRSLETLKSYTTGLRQFLAWCAANDVEPRLNRDTVNRWVAELLDSGRQAKTALTRQQSLCLFSAWLAEEQEIPHDELLGLKPVRLDKKVVARLSDEECRRLLDSCKSRSFRNVRDNAILRLMLESALRASDVVNIKLSDVNLREGVVTVRRSKGGKGRVVPFSAQCGQALDRYIRMRRKHVLSESSGALWLGTDSKGFGYPGLYCSLKRRAEQAGVKDFHPHLTRHTSAQRWLAAGGSEGGLMTVAGWSTRSMMDRYTAATASERAAVESRQLGLGEF